MSLPAWPQMSIFMALMLTVCMFGVIVAGHFPPQHRAEKFKTRLGNATLWGSLVVACPSAAFALIFAAIVLPWYAAVIGGGLMVLTAPLLLQPLPDRIVDGKFALLALAGTALLLDAVAIQLL